MYERIFITPKGQLKRDTGCGGSLAARCAHGCTTHCAHGCTGGGHPRRTRHPAESPAGALPFPPKRWHCRQTGRGRPSLWCRICAAFPRRKHHCKFLGLSLPFLVCSTAPLTASFCSRPRRSSSKTHRTVVYHAIIDYHHVFSVWAVVVVRRSSDIQLCAGLGPSPSPLANRLGPDSAQTT